MVTTKLLPKEFPDINVSYYLIGIAIIEFLPILGIKFDIYLKKSKIIANKIKELI